METLARMDAYAAGFRGFTAKFIRVNYEAGVQETETSHGTIWLKRPNPKELKVKLDIQPPNPSITVSDGKTATVFYPNNPEDPMKIELGQKRSAIDAYLSLGFGGNSKELLNAYLVKLGGPEVVAGQPTMKLDLTPKTPDKVSQAKRIELWVSDKDGSAIQQKLYTQGKSYTLITYSDIQKNPDLPDSIFKLPIPRGTKPEVLNKKK